MDSSSRIHDKLDRIEEQIGIINVTLAKQHEQLRFHIRRTTLLEEHLEHLRGEVKPIQRHVAIIDGGLKVLGAISAIVAFVATALKVVEFFN